MSTHKFQLQATTWWLLAIIGAAFASMSQSLIFLIATCISSFACMALFRDNSIRSRSLAFYAYLALSVVLIRVVFRVIFNQPDPQLPTAIDFPQITFFVGNMQFSLFGAVSVLNLESATTDGLRLAAIILPVAMANTVANPRKLLRSTPTALYEVATAAAVAINLAPQLIESLHRVQRARQLRGQAKGLHGFAKTVVPVLEDTLERSLGLAASMDSRGFGLQGSLSPKQQISTRVFALVGVFLVALSSVFVLVSNIRFEIALLGFGLGVALFAHSARISAKHKVRSFYSVERPGIRDYTTLVITSCCLLILFWLTVQK